MIDRAKRYIYEGDIFQVVLSNPLTAPATGSLFDTYQSFVVKTPLPMLSAGTTTDKVFDLVQKVRTRSAIPLTFMTYANVIFSLRDRSVCTKSSRGWHRWHYFARCPL